MEENRLRYVKVFPHFVFRNGEHHFRIINPLPDDARFIRGEHDYMGVLYLIYYSSEFEELKSDGEIPEHKIEFENIANDEVKLT